MSAIAIPLLLAGTAVSTAAVLKQGQVTQATQEYNARVAEAQARAFEDVGAFESGALQKQSEFERFKIRREKARALSMQRAKFAKAGVRIDEGTPLDVMADTAAEFEMEIAANKYNVQLGLEKIRYESETGIARSKTESTYRKLLGKQARRTSYLQAGGTLLTGLGQAGFMSGSGSGGSEKK